MAKPPDDSAQCIFSGFLRTKSVSYSSSYTPPDLSTILMKLANMSQVIFE